MDKQLLNSITSNYPFFLKTKENYYKAYSHKIDDEILGESEPEKSTNEKKLDKIIFNYWYYYYTNYSYNYYSDVYCA